MRRRLALLVSATMALMLIAFVVPLAILVRGIVADRAMTGATDDVQHAERADSGEPGPEPARRASG